MRWAKIYAKNFGLAGEDRIWPGLGWFSGLMCVGSMAGAVSWGAYMQAHALEYEGSAATLALQQVLLVDASQSQWNATFCITYGLEFLCFIVPKLMMLGRLTENTTGSSQAQSVDMDRTRRLWHGGPDGLRRRALPMLFRAMAAAVVLCSVVGMVALVRAAAFEMQAAGVFDQAAAACGTEGNVTVTCSDLKNQTRAIGTDAATAVSVQGVCEAVALMITASSYLLLVLRNVALYRRAQEVSSSALLSLVHSHNSIVSVPAVFAETDYAGAVDSSVQLGRGSAVEIVQDTQKAAVEQRRRLVAACAIVLVSFPARAAFDLLNAYSQFRCVHACHTFLGVIVC